MPFITELRPVRSMHLYEDNSLPFRSALLGKDAELFIDMEDPRGNCCVLNHLTHALADIPEVEVLYAVIRPCVNGEEVRQGLGDGAFGLLTDLVDPEPSPSFVAPILHAAGFTRSHHLDLVAVGDEHIAEELAIAVSVGRSGAVSD
ncbi:unnamed protein product [Parascedosporium putredinis]|uniref:Uncharacterized protein n=1 Tax=Parascedosporium putredinis TaxID=1442378 RepID=A0A9P1H6N4_9PEZI|nr:unnamed protein product [Parascedosporium putredinis]CAI8000385.1 unnamed protein product [Parascedosporium putredinis]